MIVIQEAMRLMSDTNKHFPDNESFKAWIKMVIRKLKTEERLSDNDKGLYYLVQKAVDDKEKAERNPEKGNGSDWFDI